MLETRAVGKTQRLIAKRPGRTEAAVVNTRMAALVGRRLSSPGKPCGALRSVPDYLVDGLDDDLPMLKLRSTCSPFDRMSLLAAERKHRSPNMGRSPQQVEDSPPQRAAPIGSDQCPCRIQMS